MAKNESWLGQRRIRTRLLLAVAVAVFGGLAVAILATVVAPPERSIPAFAYGFATGALFAAVLSALYIHTIVQLGRIPVLIQELSQQQQALINLRPLLGRVPVPFDGSAMQPLIAETIVLTILRHRPRLILECGSGSSTVLIAELLRTLGRGKVVSLDHLPHFAEATRRNIRSHQLEDWATVVDAPLEDWQIDGQTLRWYGPAFREHLDEEVDLLIVDGPPAVSGQQSRYPALPLLHESLTADCRIIMDDAGRDEEAAIADRWMSELPCHQERYIASGKGTRILRMDSAHRPSPHQDRTSRNMNP